MTAALVSLDALGLAVNGILLGLFAWCLWPHRDPRTGRRR